MAKVFFGCPIFRWQELNVRKNHEFVRATSEHEITYCEIIGASVEHSKQIMYKKFLETDCDYFFNVDADIYFLETNEQNPIDVLISDNKDIVGGIYVYKKKPCLPTHRPLDLQEIYEKDGKFPENYKFNIPNESHEVKWLSGGCNMIKRTVIEKLMAKHLVPNLPMIYKNEYLSEDFSFCNRARDEGFSIFAEPKIKLGHVGTYLYKLSDYLNIE